MFMTSLPLLNSFINELTVSFIGYKTATKDILVIAIPSTVNLVFEMLVEVVNIVFAGHLNDSLTLAGVGLGNLMVNITAIAVSVGMNGAIDTLVSQAYGDKEYYLWGCYLNRGRIIQFLFNIPQIFILLYSKEILVLLGQNESACEVAQIYINGMIPAVIAVTQFETTRRYLQGMGIFYITMYIQTFTMLLHFLWGYLLVFYFGFGLVGIAAATSITYFSDFLLIHIVVHFYKGLVPRESWHFFNADSFKGFLEFLYYGVPSALVYSLEWWSFEILSIFAGFLSIQELAANVVILNICIFLYQIPEGVGFAISNLVGNSLGEMNAHKSKRYAFTCIGIMIVSCFFLIMILIPFKYYFSLAFTEELNVVDLVSDILPVFTVWIFIDHIQCVECGIIRAMGFQMYSSVISFVSYWILNIPIAYLLAIPMGYRLTGIWLGVQVGSLFACISYLLILIFTDWNKLVIDKLITIKLISRVN